MRVPIIALALLFLPFAAFSQYSYDSDSDIVSDFDVPDVVEVTDPEEQAIFLPKGDTIEEGAPIEDMIEGVGTITFAATAVYELPNKDARVLRFAFPGEKVIVRNTDPNWYFVRMYNGREGYVEKRFLKTAKAFANEAYTPSLIDRRVSVELDDMVDRFNKALKGSVFADKYKIIPRLTLVNSAKRLGEIVITLEYSAVDNYGLVVPSKQENMLQNEVSRFVELLFMKMLPTGAERYRIVVHKPVFSSRGQVLNTQGHYAEIVLDHKAVDIKSLKERKVGTVFKAVKSDVPADKLFKEFPN